MLSDYHLNRYNAHLYGHVVEQLNELFCFIPSRSKYMRDNGFVYDALSSNRRGLAVYIDFVGMDNQFLSSHAVASMVDRGIWHDYRKTWLQAFRFTMSQFNHPKKDMTYRMIVMGALKIFHCATIIDRYSYIRKTDRPGKFVFIYRDKPMTDVRSYVSGSRIEVSRVAVHPRWSGSSRLCGELSYMDRIVNTDIKSVIVPRKF